MTPYPYTKTPAPLFLVIHWVEREEYVHRVGNSSSRLHTGRRYRSRGAVRAYRLTLEHCNRQAYLGVRDNSRLFARPFTRGIRLLDCRIPPRHCLLQHAIWDAPLVAQGLEAAISSCDRSRPTIRLLLFWRGAMSGHRHLKWSDYRAASRSTPGLDRPPRWISAS